MKRTERRNIRAVTVAVYDAGDDHHEFVIEVPNVAWALEDGNCHLYNDLTQAEVWRALNTVDVRSAIADRLER